jgi:hypothetical protein
MGIASSISRFTEYYKRHGLAATLGRARVALKRALFARRMAVFYCDLDAQKLPRVNVPKTMRVERITALAELGAERFQAITSHWNPTLAARNIRERFENGASLWLVESEGQLAGYGWTLQGKTIAEYYFPLGPDDVQLFDFYVFPRFRGRALHWLLTGYTLHALAADGGSRAYADTGEWNEAQLASFKMTPFRFLGMVRTYRILGRELSCWDGNEPAGWKQKGAVRRNGPAKVLRPNE